MKLLYVWIEEFRNIKQQGFVVDNEYRVSVEIPDGDSFGFYDSRGCRVLGASSELWRKIFYRKFSYEKNDSYSDHLGNSPIQSITALAGENASGKSSIIECIHQRADQFNYQNKEGRYFLLVFLDTDHHSIVVRTRDIWLHGFEDKKNDKRSNDGYEEYVFPLSETDPIPSAQAENATKLISIYQDHREETLYAYMTMGLLAIPINIERKNFRNSFIGIFDFLCEFPQFGAEGNQIVFYLKDEESRETAAYFKKTDLNPDEYKNYFLRKLSQLLFGTLRSYLYHEKPQFTMAGTRIKRPEEGILNQEDIACAEVLSFCTFDYPRSDSTSLVKITWGSTPEAAISAAIAFFRKSTYVYSGKSLYDQYLDCVERLFSSLYKLDTQYFPALYKVSLPIRREFRNVIESFGNCIMYGDEGAHWADSIISDFEWFSAGQQQMSLMFSGLYQRLKHEYGTEKNEDLILMLDEPETHMHPEAGRHFIEALDCALMHFQSAGLFRHCQIILATHSPFLIQSLSDYPANIALTESCQGRITICDFQNLQYLHLPGWSNYSFNLVMYYVFHVPTTELHDELYGYLQETKKCYSENRLDNWFLSNTSIRKTKTWIPVIDGQEGKPKAVTLQRYIRNFIHHPENTKNLKYTPTELKRSIEEMLSCLSY